jgi:uroporphyrin-3 C-methyltransferase
LASAVRGTLAAELDALAALPRIDAAAVQSRLAALFADLDRWPLRDGAEPAAEPTGESPPWYRAWLRLDNYLSIRRVAPEEGLDPFLEGSARLALRAQIALARLLLLQHRHDEIPALLAGARRSLAAFDPDHPGVARAAQGLDDLAREPFNQPLPQIGLALDELRRLRGLRVLADPADAPAAMPDASTDDAVGPAEDQQP